MRLAVCGGKGGVGKSTVAMNLARELNGLVVDADLATPDLPRGRGPDLHEVLADRAAPMEAVDDHGTIDVLPSGRSVAGTRAAELERFPEVVDLVKRRYGWVVIDCPAGLARDVGYQIHSADAVVLVTMAERAALVNAVRTRRLAEKLDTPVAAVVLNKVSSESEESMAEPIEEEFGTPTVAVPRRMEIQDAQAAGTPLRDYRPDCVAVDSFASLAETIEGSEQQLSLSLA